MNYAESTAKHHAQVAAQELEKKNRTVWNAILAQYTMAGHEANYKAVLEYCQCKLSIPKFEWMLQHDPQKLDLKDDRDSLIERIMKLLSHLSEHDKHTWSVRLKHMTTPELRARLNDIATRRAMNERPVGELREALAQHRHQEFVSKSTPEGFERIPATIEYNGVEMPIRDYLNKIVKEGNLTLIKRAVTRFGSKQFDAARRGY